MLQMNKFVYIRFNNIVFKIIALIFIFYSGGLFAGIATDSTRSSQKKINKEAEKLALKESHIRYLTKLSYVYATMDTKLSFELPNEI